MQDAPAQVPEGTAGKLLTDPAEPGGIHRGLTADRELQPSARGGPEPDLPEEGAGPSKHWALAPPSPQFGPGLMGLQSRISLMAERE